MYNAVKKIEDSNITIVKSISYFEGGIEEYKEEFENYIRKGVIRDASNFNENNWRLYDEVHHRLINFDIDELQFEAQKKLRGFNFEYCDLINSIKCFTLLLIGQYRIFTIYDIITGIKKLLIESHFLNNNYLKETKKLLKEYFVNPFYIRIAMDFFDYFEELTISEQYFIILENESSKKFKNKIRMLPKFESIFKFSEIMDNFIDNYDSDEKLKKIERFFPVILWWYITSKIPLRSTEFTLIPYKCIKVVDGKYKLVLLRSKLKGKKKKTQGELLYSIKGGYYECEIEVNKNIFNLINWYKTLVDKYDLVEDFYGNGCGDAGERKFLLSYRSYFNFLSNPNKSNAKSKFQLDFFSLSELRTLINNFYSEVVFKEYNIIQKGPIYNPDNLNELDKGKERELLPYEIELIQCMDTRHFAIIDMILQDVPLVAVKELAGHNRIDTTYGYFNQIDRYVENYTYYLSKKYAKEEGTENILNLKLNSPPDAKSLYYQEKIEKGEIKSKKCNGGKGWCIFNDEIETRPCRKLDFNCASGCHYYVSRLDEIADIEKAMAGNNKEIDTSIVVIKQLIKQRKVIQDFETRFRTEIIKIRSCAEQNACIINEHVINKY